MAPLLCLLRGGPDSDLCAPSYVARVGNTPPMTLADHQRSAKAFYARFPDLQHMVEETVADNEKGCGPVHPSGHAERPLHGASTHAKAIREAGSNEPGDFSFLRPIESHSEWTWLGFRAALLSDRR